MASSQDCTVCEACNAIIKPASALAAHLSSREHVERVQGNFVWCSICSKAMIRSNWAPHMNGKGHRKAAAQQGVRANLPPMIPAAVDGHRKCKVCNLFVVTNQVAAHANSKGHRAKLAARERVQEVQRFLREAANDKEDVTVSKPDGIDFGVVELVSPGSVKRTHLIAKTSSHNIRLVQAKARHPNTTGLSDMCVPYEVRLSCVKR
jgi:hypothetical protein